MKHDLAVEPNFTRISIGLFGSSFSKTKLGLLQIYGARIWTLAIKFGLTNMWLMLSPQIISNFESISSLA